MINFFISIFSSPPTPYVRQYSDDDIDSAIAICLFGERTTNRKTVTQEEPTKKKPQKKKEESLPTNIKELTLPDGSVVYINTDETEMTEESVIDSITRTK
jgi:hypothetical protein